ncbi:MAG: hypothetical protein O6852_03270 [Gammaproteobacteria bacterium]|nr:hypothetical protein [Gammaproteobacteria bacterium]
MNAPIYKKMAGTSAVFLFADFAKASPVERDRMIWTANELHLEQLPQQRQQKPAMANTLALEGLEEYDIPNNGDVRWVESMGAEFIYYDLIRGWVQFN